MIVYNKQCDIVSLDLTWPYDHPTKILCKKILKYLKKTFCNLQASYNCKMAIHNMLYLFMA